MVKFPFFFLAFCLALGQLVSGSGRLVERQGCDTTFCLPSPGDVIKAGVALFQLGVEAIQLFKPSTKPSESEDPALVIQEFDECGNLKTPGSDQVSDG